MTTGTRLSQQEAEQFLYREAKLLDDRKYEEWLKLFTPDGVYWIPLEDTTNPRLEPSILYDDPQQRAMRVHQLLYTPHWAQRPPSRTVHVISNVMVADGDAADEALVWCNLVCHELREGDHRQLGLGIERAFAAQCEYRLRYLRGQGWAIALRKLLLINRGLPIRNLSFIL